MTTGPDLSADDAGVSGNDTSNATAELMGRLDRLQAEKRWDEAIELATAANRSHRHAGLEKRLVLLRHLAAKDLVPTDVPESWPPPVPDEFEGVSGIPEIDPAALSARIVGSAIQHHGALLVRGLVPSARAESLARGIDRAVDGYDAWADGRLDETTKPWFSPAPLSPRETEELARGWVRDHGGILWADSPRMMFEMLESYRENGLLDLVREYLGERPVVSATKCTLRRTIPTDREHGWHQDGKFLRKEGPIRTLNVWLSLSHCGEGTRSAGMEVVPSRLAGIVTTGTEGAELDWCVGPGVVTREAGDAGVTHPRFAPGDVLMFDEVFLHRTASGADLPEPRYAVETWFFAPSHFPASYPPLLV